LTPEKHAEVLLRLKRRAAAGKFIKLPLSVMMHTHMLSSAALRALLALYAHKNHETAKARPGRATLAVLSGRSERIMRRALAELQEAGTAPDHYYRFIEGNRSGGRGKSTEFELLDPPEKVECIRPRFSNREKGDRSGPKGGSFQHLKGDRTRRKRGNPGVVGRYSEETLEDTRGENARTSGACDPPPQNSLKNQEGLDAVLEAIGNKKPEPGNGGTRREPTEVEKRCLEAIGPAPPKSAGEGARREYLKKQAEWIAHQETTA